MHGCTVHGFHKFHFSVTFSLKWGPTALFIHLKNISLQCFQFQFSVSTKISSIQTDPRFHKNRKRRNDFMNSVEKIKHKAFNSSVVFYGVRKSFFFHIFWCQESFIYKSRNIFCILPWGAGVEH